MTQKKELGGSLQTLVIERVAAAPLPPQQNQFFSIFFFSFLASLVALHLTPVSDEVSKSVMVSDWD